MLSLHDDFCWHRRFLHILLCQTGSYTSQTHPSTPATHLRLLSSQIVPGDRLMPGRPELNALWIRESTSLAMRAGLLDIPISTHTHNISQGSLALVMSGMSSTYGCHFTPLTRSKISRIATQNSSKSSSPSPSRSDRSQTFSSCSSRSRLFRRTLAACELFRRGWPLVSDEKISQYRSISHCSILLFDMVPATATPTDREPKEKRQQQK